MRYLIALAVATSVACHSPAKPHEVTPSIEKILAGKPRSTVESANWTEVKAFYTQRNNEPAWVDQRRPVGNAKEAIEVLGTARQHGFDPADYGASELLEKSQAVEKIQKGTQERFERVADIDVQLTAAMLRFGHDVAVGRQNGDGHFKARRQQPDLVAALEKDIDHPAHFIDAVRPPHQEYVALQKAMDALIGQREKGGWPKVPSANDAEAVKQRLAAGNYPDVKSFQELNGLPETGVVDKATLAAMNVPIDDRIRQVAINLQRWRWMPDDLGDQHFLVNIPYFHLIASESGHSVMDIRVVVGKPGHETPIFSQDMTTVVFSPYWNIPDTIAENETAPAVARDPAYLERQGIEILRVSNTGTQVVNSSDVDWNNADAVKGLVFRQKPGDSNALGHVKFLFPNQYNVYIHDTPADALFAKPGRAFSHGCVRVEEPETLAKYVLKGYQDWPEERIFEAMRAGVEKQVPLKKKIPVHIAYFTAWVDDNGGLHFQPDIYGYDHLNDK